MSGGQTYERIPFDDTTLPIRINYGMVLNPQNTLQSPETSWHEQIELLYFRDGEALVCCGNQTYTVSAGDVVIINPFEVHRIAYLSGTPCYECLMIDSTLYRNTPLKNEETCFFNLLADGKIGFENVVRDDAEILYHIEALCREVKARPLLYDVMIRSHVLALLVGLLRRHAQSDVSFYRLIDNLQQYDRIQPALTLMRNNLNEHISLETLANACHLSSSHFCRLFRQITGYSPIQYFLDLRIQEAATLLKRTDKTIGQIAYEVGFDDMGYFSRKFKEHFGVSPTKLKKHPPIE